MYYVHLLYHRCSDQTSKVENDNFQEKVNPEYFLFQKRDGNHI